MKIGKKVVCFMLALLIMISGVSLSAYAQESSEETAAVVEEQPPQSEGELEAAVEEAEPAQTDASEEVAAVDPAETVELPKLQKNTENADMDATINVNVEIVWDDDNDAAGKRPEKIYTTLLGSEPEGEYADGLDVTKEDGWKHTFVAPKYEYDGRNEMDFVVFGEEVPCYTSQVEKISQDEDGIAFRITNTYTPADTDTADSTITITVKTVWDDNNNALGLRQENVWVYLCEGGKYDPKKDYLWDVNYTTGNEENNWTTTFTARKNDADGNEIQYGIYEEGGDWEDFLHNYYYDYASKVELTSQSEDSMTFTVINTLKPVVRVTVEKVWDDNDDALGLRPDDVLAAFYAEGKFVRGLGIYEDENWVASCYLLKYDDEGNEIEYTLVEDEPAGYTGQAEEISRDENGIAFRITNTYTPLPSDMTDSDITVTVKTVWDDNNNAAGLRPEELDVYLFNARDGQNEVDFNLVNEKNGWAYTFTVPKYDADGNEITYFPYVPHVPYYTPKAEGMSRDESQITFEITMACSASQTSEDETASNSNSKTAPTTASKTAPKTGDSSRIVVWTGLLAVSCLGTAMLLRRRNAEKNHR